MTAAPVRCQQHGTVVEIRLDRADRRNALSRALLHGLRRAIASVPTGTHAVVITASGPVFTAGADFADLTGTSADLDYDRDLEATCAAVRSCPAPVIAAIDGPCLGAGVELALSCDARVVGPHAWFRVPAVELGLLYNPRSIRHLHATLPRTTLTRLLLFAERIDADDALVCGLATHRTDSNVVGQALALAETFIRLPSAAVTATRSLLRALDEDRYVDDEWQSLRTKLLDSPARREAVTAAARRHGLIAP